jgi:hypothetical protein
MKTEKEREREREGGGGYLIDTYYKHIFYGLVDTSGKNTDPEKEHAVLHLYTSNMTSQKEGEY